MDSTTLATSEEEKTSAKIVEEAIGASNSPSPRRKISVYCRSFDVVTVQDECEDRQGSNEKVRQSPSNSGESSARVDERLVPEKDQNSTSRYPFGCNYRNTKNDSDSSNDSTPQKQFRNSLLEDELPIEQPVLRRVCLAPTRLKLPQNINELSETARVPANSTKPNVSNSSLSSIVDNECEEDDALRSSTTFIVDKCETEIQEGIRESKPCSENFPRERSTSARRLFPCNHTGKFFDLDDWSQLSWNTWNLCYIMLIYYYAKREEYIECISCIKVIGNCASSLLHPSRDETSCRFLSSCFTLSISQFYFLPQIQGRSWIQRIPTLRRACKESRVNRESCGQSMVKCRVARTVRTASASRRRSRVIEASPRKSIRPPVPCRLHHRTIWHNLRR